MIAKVLIFSTWFVLAGTFHLILPDIDHHADIFKDSELQPELNSTIDPESLTDLDLADAVGSLTDLALADALESLTDKDLAGAVESLADKDLAGAIESPSELDLAEAVESLTDLALADALESLTDKDLAGAVESTTDAQALELSTEVGSNIPSIMGEATQVATASVPGDYLEEPITGAPDEPSTSMESNEFTSELVY